MQVEVNVLKLGYPTWNAGEHTENVSTVREAELTVAV